MKLRNKCDFNFDSNWNLPIGAWNTVFKNIMTDDDRTIYIRKYKKVAKRVCYNIYNSRTAVPILIIFIFLNLKKITIDFTRVDIHMTRRLPHIRRCLTKENKPECLYRRKIENIFLTSHCNTYFCSFIDFSPYIVITNRIWLKSVHPLLSFK